MTKKIRKIEGLVIDKRDRGEKDIIFTILTPDEGKTDVLAKHAKKVPSRHNSGLELFNIVRCQLYQGKILPVVTQSQQIGAFPILINTYSRLMAGYEILRSLKMLVAPSQHINRLYDFVVKTCSLLNTQSLDENHIVTIFKLKLLRMLGVFHPSAVCDQCGKPLKGKIIFFHYRFLCSHCSQEGDISFSSTTNKNIIQMSEQTYDHLVNKRLSRPVEKEIVRVIELFSTLQLPSRA